MSKNRLKAEFRRAVLLRLNRRRQTKGEAQTKTISNEELLALCDTLVEIFHEEFEGKLKETKRC
jgi:hypothetical protein